MNLRTRGKRSNADHASYTSVNWDCAPGRRFAVFMATALVLQLGGMTVRAQGANDGNGFKVDLSSSIFKDSENTGEDVFLDYCARCHGKLTTAPSKATLRKMTPEKIYEALTSGVMRDVASKYPDKKKRLVAEWLGGRRIDIASRVNVGGISNRCHARMTIDSLDSRAWPGWGRDLSNSRFQQNDAAEGLSKASVSRLKLKWAFALPEATSVYGQPAVVDGKVFVSADTGNVYAVDAATGCVYWSFQAVASVRSAISLGTIPGVQARYAAYFGDTRGNVYALDATTGELIWKASVEDHSLARIHGATKFYAGRLYVPIASLEEDEAIDSSYECCTFRGSVVALDASTGHTIWKTYTISEAPTRRVTASGVPYLGPSGAGVFSTPAIDPMQNALYVGTGNGYSGPATSESDAVIALDLDTGKVLWTKQGFHDDIWVVGCAIGDLPGSNPRPGGDGLCTAPLIADEDIAASPIVGNVPNGRRLVIVAQKSVGVWAYDPEHKGALVWRQSNLSPEGMPDSSATIMFGGATDGETLYFGVTLDSTRGRGWGELLALDLKTGNRKWSRIVAPQVSQKSHPGISAAVSAIPGVVFCGGLDGMLRAFSSTDGSLLWSFDTTQKIRTVNGLVGKGGSIGEAGPVVAGGMLFVNSGYVGHLSGVAGNVLLAFSP